MSNYQVLGSAYYVEHVTVISVFSGLASVAVVLRFWARGIQKMSLELSDYLIVPGLFCALGESAVNVYGCSFGIVKYQSPEEIQKAIIYAQKSLFMAPIVWVASVTFIRASIISLYIRIFPTRLFRMVCYAVLVVNLVFFMGVILADCLICRPIPYRWNRIIGGKGSCGDQKSLDLFIGILNLVLDVTAVVLPMPVLWGLKMAMGKKVMLSFMFGMGTATCALTLYRIYDTTTIDPSNVQKAYAVIDLFSSLEALLGTINACLPVLKPIFDRMRGAVPKTGPAPSGVRQILKLGSIPIFFRVSQVLTRSRRRTNDSSNDEVNLTETTGWHEEIETTSKVNADGGKATSVTTEAISPPIIHVRNDVDVESVVSRDERGEVGDSWEGRQERW